MHPELGVTRRSMSVLNSYVVDLFDRITNEASRLVRYNKKATLSSREIQTAVRIVLPGALAKHATEHAIHATAKYQNSFGKKSADATPSTPEST
jgi:histone H2B